MFVELVIAAALGAIVVLVAILTRRRTTIAHAQPLPRVAAATGVGALVAYNLGDALGGYDTLLGYGVVALAVFGVLVVHAHHVANTDATI